MSLLTDRHVALASALHSRLGVQSWLGMLKPELVEMFGSFVMKDFAAIDFRPNRANVLSDFDGYADEFVHYSDEVNALNNQPTLDIQRVVIKWFDKIELSNTDRSHLHGFAADCTINHRDGYWVEDSVRFYIATSGSEHYSIMEGLICFPTCYYCGPVIFREGQDYRVSVCPLQARPKVVKPCWKRSRFSMVNIFGEVGRASRTIADVAVFYRAL